MGVPLDANAVYLTPSGRRCRWLPLAGKYGCFTAWAHFVYLSRHHALKEGFVLTARNYGILRKEVEHAAAG